MCGDRDPSLAAHFHPVQTHIPALDNFTLAEPELEPRTLRGGVELLVVRLELTHVVDGNLEERKWE
jgi:hypothetical protein